MGKINDSIELVKTGLEVKTLLATAEDKEKLADAKLALADLKSDMADLKEENSNLKEMLTRKEDFVLDKGVWWDVKDTEKDQPFCPACFAKGIENPLQKQWAGHSKTQSPWHCPEKTCNAMYNPWDYKAPSRSQISW